MTLKVDQKELQERLNATTQITSNTVSNLCINFLTNQALTPNDVILMGVIIGVIVGVVVGIIIVTMCTIFFWYHFLRKIKKGYSFVDFKSIFHLSSNFDEKFKL